MPRQWYRPVLRDPAVPRILYIFFVERSNGLVVVAIIDHGGYWVKEVFKPLVNPPVTVVSGDR